MSYQIDRSGVITKAMLRAAQRLGLNQGETANVLGISSARVSRMASGEYRLDQRRKEWELAILLVRLYDALAAILASDDAGLRDWMRHPNRDLHAVPIARIVTVAGLVETVNYLEANRARV